LLASKGCSGCRSKVSLSCYRSKRMRFNLRFDSRMGLSPAAFFRLWSKIPLTDRNSRWPYLLPDSGPSIRSLLSPGHHWINGTYRSIPSQLASGVRLRFLLFRNPKAFFSSLKFFSNLLPLRKSRRVSFGGFFFLSPRSPFRLTSRSTLDPLGSRIGFLQLTFNSPLAHEPVRYSPPQPN